MQPQEIFDAVLAHLAKQQERGATDGRCAYRTVDGRKCAVGALIPDDLYDYDMDGIGKYSGGVNAVIRGILDGVYSERLMFLVPHEGLLASLQAVHDARESWDYKWTMRAKLEDIAEFYDLDGSNIEDTVTAIFG